jgi:hypothetical protein
LLVVSLAGDVVDVTPFWDRFQNPWWSDATHLVLCAPCVVVDVAAPSLTATRDDAAVARRPDPLASPDGRWLIERSGTEHITNSLLDRTSGKRVQRLPDGIGPIGWLADGRFAHTLRTDAGTALVAFDPLSLRSAELARFQGSIRDSQMDESRRVIVLSEQRQGETHLWRFELGGAATPVPESGDFTSRSIIIESVSRDATYLSFREWVSHPAVGAPRYTYRAGVIDVASGGREYACDDDCYAFIIR